MSDAERHGMVKYFILIGLEITKYLIIVQKLIYSLL